MSVSDALLAELRAVDTPTICNALELVVTPREKIRFTTRPYVATEPEAVLVGFARTCTIRAEAESSLPGPEKRKLRLAWYEHVATAKPGPNIAVIQDLDSTPGTGAFWGEVNTTVHKGLGVLGCVTNGSIRDLGMVAKPFPLIAGVVNPSHAFVHVTSVGTEVSIHGMVVRDGDLIHADRHGAAVIPLAVADKLPGAIDLGARREKVILDAARAPGFSFAVLKKALENADEIH
jgi:regulator of RNase E activity RraA